MKRCPKCNQTFDEDWLAFCTQDGTTLIEDSVSRNEPPPTMMSSGPPPPVSAPPAGWSQPSGGFGSGQFPSPPAVPAPPPPANWNQPSGGFGSSQFPQPQPIQSGWQPPPPPSYGGPTQGLAVASMICGIFSVTIGWCYVGVITSPIALGLGIYSLIQIKNYPDKFTGRPLAITGVVTGSIYILVALIFLIYVVAIFMGNLK